MNGIKGFFNGLSKSTKITMIACVFFILLTLLILCFFIIFPITPSATTVAKIGKDGMVYRDPAMTSTTAVTTVAETETTTEIVTSLENPTENATIVTFTAPAINNQDPYVQEVVPPQENYTETAPVVGVVPGEYGVEEVTEAPDELPEPVTDPPVEQDPNMPPLAPDVPAQAVPVPTESIAVPTEGNPVDVPAIDPNGGPEIVLD